MLQGSNKPVISLKGVGGFFLGGGLVFGGVLLDFLFVLAEQRILVDRQDKLFNVWNIHVPI